MHKTKRRIPFAGFVARMEDTRLPKCVIFGELVEGAGCVGGQEKEWTGCLLMMHPRQREGLRVSEKMI